MVAEQAVHLAARRGRLRAQPLEQLVELLGLAAAVDEVARLHEHGVATRPAARVVDELGEAERAHAGVQIAVQVRDRHEPALVPEPRGDSQREEAQSDPPPHLA